MLVYIIMLTISCFGCFLADKVKIKSNKIIAFIIAFLPIFLVSAVRFEVGQDYIDTYIYTFNKVLMGATNIRIDFGFLCLNRIIVFLGGSYQWVFIISSFIINIFICKSIFNKSNNKLLSMFIYICGTLFFFSLNGIRQTMALALFYYSLRYIETNNTKRYLLINVVGALFHASALLFLPLYFILSKRISTKIKLFIIMFIIIIMPISISLIQNFLLTTKYSMYITNGAYNPLEAINVSTVVNILLFTAYEYTFHTKKTNEKEFNIYDNIHFIGVIVSLFITQISLALRVFMYFRYIEFLSVPYIISKIGFKKRNYQIVVIIICILYFVYFLHGVYIENGNNVLPYKSIFFN